MNETTAIEFSDKMKNHLLEWGLSDTMATYVVDFSAFFMVILVSVILYYIAKFIINRVLKRIILRSASQWDDHLYQQKVFTRLALLIPALILHVTVEPILTSHPAAVKYIQLGVSIYITFIFLLTILSFLNAVGKIYQEFEVSNSKPIKGYIQFVKIIVIVVAGIIMISILVGKSPVSMLVGLGTMSAVIMFIFKDAILGFIAGIQLSSNKAVQIGDWIAAPKFNADGTVFDISLVTVKVRNFDHSVSLLPTYSLITDSFINWRSFGEAGGRRLKRSFLIDVRTVENTNDEMLDYLRSKGYPIESILPKNEQITNLGLFRRYLAFYLRNQSVINQDATLMIRQLQPTENGLPVEVYAFFTSTEWVAFENFQADFFEHLYATLPEFGLKAFQRISNVLPELEPFAPKKNEP